MIKEFAVQPEVMGTWTHFRELRADFEVGLGRLLCRYPKSWTRDICAFVDHQIANRQLGDIHGNAIKNFVSGDRERHRFIPARGRAYSPSPAKTWLQNAEESTLPEPFDGIVASENPRRHPAVLVAGDFDRSTAPFATRKQLDIEKSPAALAKCASKLLLICEELRIIDPFFDPLTKGFDETLLEMLDIVKERQRPVRVLEIHLRRPDVFVKDVQRAHYKTKLQKELPTGCALKVVFWTDVPGGLHPRYLLTELGGIKYDWGFDMRREAHHLNEVILLEHEHFQELQQRYSLTQTACTVIDIP